MRKLALVLVIVLCLVGAVFFLNKEEGRSSRLGDKTVNEKSETKPLVIADRKMVTRSGEKSEEASDVGETEYFTAASSELGLPGNSGRRDTELVLDILFDYMEFVKDGQMPYGTNDEIVATLSGSNKFKYRFLKKGHPSVNTKGELIDVWKRPYHFHTISAEEMEVRSAGVDGILYSADDILVP